MSIIVRGKKVTKDTVNTKLFSTPHVANSTTRLHLPSMAIYRNKKDRQVAYTYQVKQVHVVTPIDTDDSVVEFIQSAVTSGNHGAPMLQEVTRNIPWVAVVITNTWLIVFNHRDPKFPVVYPKGYDLEIEEINRDWGLVDYEISMPDFNG